MPDHPRPVVCNRPPTTHPPRTVEAKGEATTCDDETVAAGKGRMDLHLQTCVIP